MKKDWKAQRAIYLAKIDEAQLGLLANDDPGARAGFLRVVKGYGELVRRLDSRLSIKIPFNQPHVDL